MARSFYLTISLFIAAQTLHASETPDHSLITSEPCRASAEEQRDFLPHLREPRESIPLQASENKLLNKIHKMSDELKLAGELSRILTAFNEEENKEWEKSFSQYKQTKGVDTYSTHFGDDELSQEEIAEWKKEKVGGIITSLQVASVFIAARNTILKPIHQNKPKKKRSKASTGSKKKKNKKALQHQRDTELMNLFTKSNNLQTTLIKNLQDFLTGTKKESPAITSYNRNAISTAFDKAVEHYGFTTKLKEHKFDACDEIIDAIEKAALPLYSDPYAEEIFKSKIRDLEDKLWEKEHKSVSFIIDRIKEKQQERNSLDKKSAKKKLYEEVCSLATKLFKTIPKNKDEEKGKEEFVKEYNRQSNEIEHEKLITQIKGKNIKGNTSKESQLDKISQTFEEAALELSKYLPENTSIITLGNAINKRQELLNEVLSQQITTLTQANEAYKVYIKSDTEKKEILAKNLPDHIDEKRGSTIKKQIQRLDESITYYSEQILDNSQKILENKKELGIL